MKKGVRVEDHEVLGFEERLSASCLSTVHVVESNISIVLRVCCMSNFRKKNVRW